jgi:hypothetical protein
MLVAVIFVLKEHLNQNYTALVSNPRFLDLGIKP